MKELKHKIQSHLSHHPTLYALIVGVGIVLFWRGVWHTVDVMHDTIGYLAQSHSLSLKDSYWWDGPVSFVVGAFTLYITGAFTSSFIGNELILAGLKGERKLTEKTDAELKSEVSAISDIKEELIIISKKLEILEKQAYKNHKNI